MNFKITMSTFYSISVATIAACVVSPPVSGQMEYMVEAMRPEYMTRDLVVFAEGLNLDDTQEVIVEAMFDSYEDDFERGWVATQERLNRIAEEIRESPPPSTKETLEPVLNALGDWLQEKRVLDDGLLDNVQAILINDQRQLWPGFIQRLYREKHIHRGRLSGETVDLFQIVRDCDFSPSAERAIADSLEEYASTLDVALRKRDSILRGNPKKLFDNILSGNSSQSASRVDDLIRARIDIRELNDRYIEILGSGLVHEDSVNFTSRALKRGYPRIYRRSPAQRILRQAAENENYPPEIIVQIVQLEGSYLQELLMINYKLLELTKSHEPAVSRHRAIAGQVRKGGGSPQKLEDPTRKVFKEREELGKRYIEMLRDLLTQEEFLDLDGASRWVPRGELPPPPMPDTPAIGLDGVLTLQGGKTGNTKGKKGQKGSKVVPIRGTGGFGTTPGGSRPSDPES